MPRKTPEVVTSHDILTLEPSKQAPFASSFHKKQNEKTILFVDARTAKEGGKLRGGKTYRKTPPQNRFSKKFGIDQTLTPLVEACKMGLEGATYGTLSPRRIA